MIITKIFTIYHTNVYPSIHIQSYIHEYVKILVAPSLQLKNCSIFQKSISLKAAKFLKRDNKNWMTNRHWFKFWNLMRWDSWEKVKTLNSEKSIEFMNFNKQGVEVLEIRQYSNWKIWEVWKVCLYIQTWRAKLRNEDMSSSAWCLYLIHFNVLQNVRCCYFLLYGLNNYRCIVK